MAQRHALPISLLTLCLLLGCNAFADDYPNIGSQFWDQDADWYQQCMRAKDIQPPAGDLSTLEETEGLAECVATELYYGALDNPRAGIAEWKQVRRCAFATNDTGVLMMLYANGFGVSRNPNLALKYACSTFGAQAEMKSRVLHFANQLRDAGDAGAGRVFDVCDQITSGLGAGECMRIESQRAASRRRARLEDITNDWTEPQKNALREAEESLHTFADLHGIEERDYEGTAAAAFAIAAEEEEIELLLADVEKLEGGSLPAYDSVRAEQFDGALDYLLQSLMQPEVFNGSNGRLGDTTITKEGLQEAQTAWLQYRDKWAAFGEARYPSVERYSWTAMITERRIIQLAEILGWVKRPPSSTGSSGGYWIPEDEAPYGASLEEIEAAAKNCVKNQITINICAWRKYRQSVERLAAAVARVRTVLAKTPDRVPIFDRAQTVWEQSRNADCDLDTSAVIGGSAAWLYAYDCREDLTNERIRLLEIYATAFETIGEPSEIGLHPDPDS